MRSQGAREYVRLFGYLNGLTLFLDNRFLSTKELSFLISDAVACRGMPPRCRRWMKRDGWEHWARSARAGTQAIAQDHTERAFLYMLRTLQVTRPSAVSKS